MPLVPQQQSVFSISGPRIDIIWLMLRVNLTRLWGAQEFDQLLF